MTKILMSASNLTGHKLEELIPQLIADLNEKCGRIAGDKSPAAQRVYRNNTGIISLLEQAQRIQLDTVRALDEVGLDQGPAGKPRIGTGSE
jgi:hypothetical protein